MEAKTKDTGQTTLSVAVNGVVFSKHFETNRTMEQQIRCIRELEMRDDDVIICAYLKSGTHWLWEMACMLLSGKAEYENRAKECAMLEAVQIEEIEQMTSPRILNTHVPATMLPRQVKAKRLKVIHVYRNVKDVIVSHYFHFKQYPGREDLTIDKLLAQSFFSSLNANGNYFSFLKTMDTFIKENADVPVFNVSYEETIQDPAGVVSRLGEFLGVRPSSELRAAITEATSLSNMRQADRTKQHLQHLPPFQIYRKGKVGDWKNHLTVAQSERLDTAVKPLDGCGFNSIYTL